LLRLGGIWRLLGRPWKGIGYLDWALTLKPGDQEISIEKAMALTDGGGWSQVRRILEPLTQSNLKSFKVQRSWVRYLAALDRREETEAGWEELDKLFPLEQDLIFQDRADFYSRKKNPDQALTVLKAAHLKNTTNLEIQKKIGRLLLQLGLGKEAESYYQNLEEKKILLDEVYLGQALLFIQQGKYESARERLWQAILKAPDSVRIRFWLWWLYDRDKSWSGEAKKITETLLEFSRNQEGGLLELADCYREIKDWKKAIPIYQELIEKGEDDDVLQSLNGVSLFLQAEEKAEELQGMLEDLQKRFPRNQKITRQLIEMYSQQKDYALAIRAIDGLLRVEDPRDPVLLIKKARLLERWNKHGESQTAYQKVLDQPVDLLFKRKISEIISLQDPLVAPLFKETSNSSSVASVNRLFEGTKEKLDSFPLESKLKEKLKTIIQGLKAEALIQKKVYLEKEGKDHLWRNQLIQARPFLEELKTIDPDNEEVYQDYDRSYRLLN
jgi:tetratricopeptide (TPR) repeat protein